MTSFFRAALMAAALLSSLPSHAFYEGFDRHFTVSQENTDIHVGVLGEGNGGPTLVYLPGFADTIDNHSALLRMFAGQGLRVIAFDYPEHGQSGGSIRWWGLPELAAIIPTVLKDPRSGFESGSPVILAGWSTGGTIAIRVAQEWQSKVIPQGSALAGIIAFAPALPARVVINVKKEDLTDGEMKHGPKPTSVPLVGQFSASITLQSKLAALGTIPAEVPALILVAGDREDGFAYSDKSARYVSTSAANVIGFQCPGAKHGLEFEPAQGATAITLAARFAGAVSQGNPEKIASLNPKLCPRIEK